MRECICSTCKKLIEIVGDDGSTGEFECVHGYPNVACETCETLECDFTCEFYEDDAVEPESITVQCANCSKDMQTDASDDGDGTYYCLDCYLKRNFPQA